MADNFNFTEGSGRKGASDQVTYSGDAADVQLVRIVQVTGAEGSKSVVDLPGDATNGILVNLGSNNDVTVTGTVAATQSGSWVIGAGTANIGDVDVLTVPAPLNLTGGGVEASALRVTLANDSTGVLSVDDNGGSLTVDGTVTANAGSGTFAVSAASLPLPSGASTAAKQPALGTAGSASADVITIQGIASMTAVTVTGTVAATQSGTWTVQPGNTANTTPWLVSIHDGTTKASVRDLSASNPIDVAIVDGSGNQIVSFGGGQQYTEDAAAAADPVGTVQMLVRKDTPASEVSADGDNVAQRGTTYGAAYVTLLDTGGSPVAVGGGTQYTEDAAAAANPIGTANILVRKDTPSAEVSADGDNIAQRGTNYGAAYVTLLDTGGSPVAVGGGTQYTEGDVDTTITGTALMWEDASDTLRPVSAAKPLPIGDAGGSITVDYATTGSGTATGALRVELPTNGTGVLASVGAVGSITSALPAGTNAIGKLAANSGVDIGDVDVTSVVPGTGATNLGKAEDAAHTTGDVGVMALSVRQDTAAALAGTDADYQPLITDSSGRLHVNVGNTVTVGAHNVTNAGTFAVQAAQSGTWNIGTVTTITNTVTVDTELAAAASLADATANPSVTSVGALNLLFNGTTWDRVRGDTTNGLDVDVTRLPALAAGTNNIGDVDVLTVPADPFGANADAASATGSISAKLRFIAATGIPVTGTVAVAGAVAHDAVDSGNPHKMGAKATTALHSVTLVADADRTDAYAGVDGVPITRPHSNLESLVSGVAAITDGSSTSVIAAAGAGVKIYITSIVIANSSATNVTVDIRDGTAGAVKATFPAPANGGVVLSLTTPLGFTANTAVAADPSASASTVTVTLIGFKSKV